MSYTYIYGSENGCWRLVGSIQNSWLWHVNIWSCLCEEYLKQELRLFGFLEETNVKEVWSLASSDKLTEFEKAVLISTMDKTIFKRSSIEWFIECVEKFDKKYPDKTSAKGIKACFDAIIDDKKLNDYENFLICTSQTLYEGRLEYNHSKCEHNDEEESVLKCEEFHEDNGSINELLSLIEGERYYEIKYDTLQDNYEGVISKAFGTI